MEQTAMERRKAISHRQREAMEGVIQSKEFSLTEYQKLREVLGRGVSTRRDASVFLEYCYARVRFQRYVDPLIAYRNRTNLTDVGFLSAKSHEFAPDEAIRRSHHR